ncbi:MAG: hypothetical protein AAFW67_13465 [Cyanobacteria bacterium J06638_38]
MNKKRPYSQILLLITLLLHLVLPITSAAAQESEEAVREDATLMELALANHELLAGLAGIFTAVGLGIWTAFDKATKVQLDKSDRARTDLEKTLRTELDVIRTQYATLQGSFNQLQGQVGVLNQEKQELTRQRELSVVLQQKLDLVEYKLKLEKEENERLHKRLQE